ncbi:hypothetical protein I3842_02G055100 [Carya illinoinensis]|uniref:Uncharacterized protein n=1 Tax=Carya illinoinensis TaxID=32201 RepID=A0A922FTV9_CARIL|nr:hypothetical protein I3842_02G055100 [Carya illinoinensis]
MTTNLLATPIWHLRKEFASFRLSTYNPFPGGKGFLVSPLPLPFLHSVATIYLWAGLVKWIFLNVQKLCTTELRK